MGGTAKIVLFLLFCSLPFLFAFQLLFLRFFTEQKRLNTKSIFGRIVAELEMGKTLVAPD